MHTRSGCIWQYAGHNDKVSSAAALSSLATGPSKNDSISILRPYRVATARPQYYVSQTHPVGYDTEQAK